MRATYTIAALLAALTVSTNIQADENAEKAQKLIDGGIKAIGGPKALKKTAKMIFEDEGLYHGMGQGLPYQGRFVTEYDKTAKFRFEILNAFVQVYNGKQGWYSLMGNTTELDGPALKAVKETVATNHIITLPPLMKPSKDYKLSLAGSQEVEGEACEGVNVAHKGTPDVTLYFSKKTGLLRKSSTTVKSSEQGFKEVVEENIFSEFDDQDGVKVAHKITILRDNKKYVESKLKSVKFPESIDASEFQKP